MKKMEECVSPHIKKAIRSISTLAYKNLETVQNEK